MKKSLIFLSIPLLLPLFLLGCGNSETIDNADNKNNTKKSVETTMHHNITAMQEKTLITRQVAAPAIKRQENTQIEGIKEKQSNTLALPRGYLTAIVDTGDEKQATIKHSDLVMTFKEQEMWEQWKIISIDAKNQQIVIRHGEQVHTLEMKAQSAPTLSDAEVVKRQQGLLKFGLKQTQRIDNEAKIKAPEISQVELDNRMARMMSFGQTR